MKDILLKSVVVLVFTLGVSCFITLGYLSDTHGETTSIENMKDSININQKAVYMPDVKLMNVALEKAKNLFQVHIEFK